MACQSIQTSKEWFAKKNIFKRISTGEVSYEIEPGKENEFNEFNEQHSLLAKERYGLWDQTTLYTIDDSKSKIRDISKNSDGSIYRGATFIKNIAVPNVAFFSAIDIAKTPASIIEQASKLPPVLRDPKEVNFMLKAVDILHSDKAKEIFEKGKKFNWSLGKTLTELQVPKDQKELLLDLNITDREQLALELASNYSYTVEINTSKTQTKFNKEFSSGEDIVIKDGKYYYYDPSEDSYTETTKDEYDKWKKEENDESFTNTSYYSNLTVPGGTNYTENEIATPLIIPSIKGHAQFATDNGIGWFRSDEQAKTEETRVGKAFDKGYLTEEEKEQYFDGGNTQEDLDEQLKNHKGNETRLASIGSKIRRILEVQSDLFQKGRDNKDLITKAGLHNIIDKTFTHNNVEYKLLFDSDTNGFKVTKKNSSDSIAKKDLPQEVIDWATDIRKNITIKENMESSSNNFLQLLNKDNNWVTFFVKSIVQDSAKKGYEKVLFPSGETAAKVEGHTTLAEQAKQIDKEIQESELFLKQTPIERENTIKEKITKEKENIEKNIPEINKIEKEIKEIKDAAVFLYQEPGYNGPGREGFTYARIQNTESPIRKGDHTDKLPKDYKGYYVFAYTNDRNAPVHDKVFPISNAEAHAAWVTEGRTPAQDNTQHIYRLEDKLRDLKGRKLQTLEDELLEINKDYKVKQYEQSLTRAIKDKQKLETEGFAKLKPVEYFYTNTVTNILNKTYSKDNVKQVTDEYGNTWNEVTIDPTRDNQSILLQKKTAEDSKLKSTPANPLMVEVITKLAEKLGIKMTTLMDYAKSNPEIDVTNMNGLADLTQKVIAIATGREDVALTEEVIHIATAIIEQTNPGLITEMISKIDRFAIYKLVLEEYKGLKAYQLANGKPDIRKIKKEAVDKLLVEILLNSEQDSDVNPELRLEENISMIKRWWQAILDLINGHYRKANIDIFKIGTSKILEGEFGTVDDITSKGVFAQTAVTNSAVENLFNTIIEIDKALKLNTVEEGFEKRHYSYTDATGVVKDIDQSVTEKIQKVFKEDRTGIDKIKDDSKKLWGTRGHEYIMNYINANLIDPITGFAKIPTNTPIATDLHEDIAVILQEFSKALIARYKPGTKFIVEKQVVNKAKTLASTIDFMAIEPSTNKNGTDGVQLDILDWKFTSIDSEITDDIPWYKQNDWKAQMNEYARMMIEYGAKPDNIRKARMVPFVIDYTDSVEGPKGTQYANSVEVGDLDNLAETKMYLLPVPIKSESTGNTAVDALVNALFAHYDKLNQKEVTSASQKFAKAERLNALSLAIRKLQVTMNFDSLVSVGHTFLRSAKTTIKSLENIDYSTLNEEQLNKGLSDLLSIQNSSQKFIDIGQVLLDAYPEGLSDQQKVTLDALGILSNNVRLLDKKVTELQNVYALHLGVSTNFVTEANAEMLLKPEKAIGYIAKTFLEGTKLSAALIRLGSNLILRANSLVDITFGKKMNEFKSILIPLEKYAQSIGVDAFSLIGKMTDKGLELIQKIDQTFIDQVKDARASKDKKFIIDNIDLDAFNKEAEEIMKKQEAILRESIFDPNDPANNDWILTVRLTKMRNAININRNTFNGWTDHTFVNLVNKHLKYENNLSKEYTNMAKTKEALAMWEYFTALNDKAKDLGYINRRETSFFPLVEATVLQKFSATENYGKEVVDFFKDLTIARIDEKKSYSKIDPETHEVVRKIPTYFTRTDKTPQKLSKDLARVGALYTKALLDYESRVNLENIMLTLYEVEKNKGGLNIDENDNIIQEGKAPQANDKTPNAAILKAIIDDSIYGISESAEGVNMGPNSKKAIENANTWVRALGVGLKYPLAIANYFGYNFQTFIMAGGVYRYREFSKNNLDISLNKLSLEQRALIDLITPLSDSVVTEKLRNFTKEYSYKSYLNTWTFSDVMQVTNSFPDRLLQMANAASFNENTMVVDGSLVNIRDYVRAQDRKDRNKLSIEERNALKASQQERINALKETSSLLKIVEVTDKGVSIPGVSDEELAKYRVRILDYGRNLNGQMDADNKAAYRRNIIMRGFMMFRTWIPKLAHVRLQDINYNAEQDNWEYGRMRLWGETLAHMGLASALRMNHIIQSTEEGIRIMDEMLEKKRAKYLAETGQELQITSEEYYDLVQQELARQVKELRMLLGILSLVVAAKVAEPPEDATILEKNRYKAWFRMISKISDELTFYYDPSTFQAVTKGNVIPAMSLVASVTKIFTSFSKETYGYVTNDQEMMDKAYPLKYFFNVIPGAYQFQTDILPYVAPELAKDMGIRVTKESRRN